MADEWLRVDQVAAQTAGHHEVLTTFTDLTGRTNTLREGCCVKCGERWPCLAVQWAAQDARWRALVGDAAPVLAAILEYATVPPEGSHYWARGWIRDESLTAVAAWLAQAQAALAGTAE